MRTESSGGQDYGRRDLGQSTSRKRSEILTTADCIPSGGQISGHGAPTEADEQLEDFVDTHCAKVDVDVTTIISLCSCREIHSLMD